MIRFKHGSLNTSGSATGPHPIHEPVVSSRGEILKDDRSLRDTELSEGTESPRVQTLKRVDEDCRVPVGNGYQWVVIAPDNLKIGANRSLENWKLHIASIGVLLGFDFFVIYGIKLDLEEISLNVGRQSSVLRVARISVTKRLVITSNSVTKVKCSLTEVIPDYVVEAYRSLLYEFQGQCIGATQHL